MRGDVSKKFLLVLIIIVMLVSMVSTWVVLEKVDEHVAKTQAERLTDTGNIKLTLIQPPDKDDFSEGKVMFAKIK